MAKTLREEDLKLNLVVNGDDARKRIIDLESAVNANQTAVRRLRNERAMLAKQGQTDSARYKELGKQIQALNQTIKQEEAELESLRGELKLEDMTMAELTNRAKILKSQLANTAPGTADWKRLNDELGRVNGRLSELRGQSGKTKSVMGTISGGFSKVAAGATAAFLAIRKVWQGIRSGVQTIADFEQANVNLSTILGKDVEDISMLTNEAMRLGAATRYTASEATGLQTELAKLGFTEREILAMGEPVLNFATALGADLSEAAALSGAALRIFGLDASETEELLGTLALATNKSALNFSYLQTAISIVGPVAKTFGFTAKDTTALLGTLANAGFDASSAATATRNIFLNLADSGGKLAKALGGPVKTFPELMDGLKRLNERGIDLATTLELTDKRSVAAFNSFLAGADSAVALRGELEDTGGVLQEIADKRMDTVEGAVASLQSAWERFILSLRNNTGWIKNAVLAARNLVQWITPKENLVTQEDIADYVRGLWSIYEVDMAKGEADREAALAEVSRAISEDQAKLEEQLRSAEAKLETTSGLRNKRRWKKEVQNLRDGLKALSFAQQEFLDRQQFAFGGRDSASGSDDVPDIVGNPAKKYGNRATWSLQQDEAFLAARAALLRQYNEGEIASQAEYDRQLCELEVATLTARLAANEESGAARARLEIELQEKILVQWKEEQKKALAAEKLIEDERAESLGSSFAKKVLEEHRRYEKEKADFAGQEEAMEAIERKHQRLMLQLRIEGLDELRTREKAHFELNRKQAEEYYNAKIALYAKGSAKEAALQKEKQLALARMDLKFLEEQKDLLLRVMQTGQSGKIDFTDDQLLAFEKEFKEVIEKINSINESIKGETLELRKGTGTGSLFGVSEAQWGMLFKNLTDGKLRAEDLANALNGLGGAAQEGFKLASQAIAMTSAKEQEELKAYQQANETKKKDLQKRLDAGLMTQAQYDAELEQMQAEQDAREEELAIRQAEREKRMNIVQAIINTALSVTKTFAQFGWPAGVAPAAIAAALGAAQVAMMSATPVTGREQGGAFIQGGRPVRVRRAQDGRPFPARLSPEQRGYIDRPTVLVGENGSEYVIPAEGLRNPSVAPFVDAIETARRAGRLRNLRLDAVQPRLAGRAAGGFFSEEIADAFAVDGTAMPGGGFVLPAASYQELLQLLRRMNTVFSKPITAEVAMLGRKGIIEKTEEYNRAKRGGQLNG